MIAIIIIFAFITMAVVYCILAGIKAYRWNENYILLKALIKESKSDSKRDYNDIERSFNEIECSTEAEMDAIKSLWAEYQKKFYSLSPYRMEEFETIKN